MSEQTCQCGRYEYGSIVVHQFTTHAEQRTCWHGWISCEESDYNFCQRCGDRLNPDGTVTPMVPAVTVADIARERDEARAAAERLAEVAHKGFLCSPTVYGDCPSASARCLECKQYLASPSEWAAHAYRSTGGAVPEQPEQPEQPEPAQ